MAIKFSNLASTTLASAVSDTATSISVTSASSFPTLGTGDYFYASLGIGSGSEVVKVTAVSGTTLTVVRGQDDTTAISHDSGVEIALRVTAASLNDLSTQADTESVSISGDTMTGALQGTQIGLGGTPHSTAALRITTTNQHIRLNNGSELGVISLLSGGEIDIWSHGDGETINLRTGSGAGTVALAITGTDSVFSGSVTSTGLTVDGATGEFRGSGANTTYFTGGDDSVSGRQLTLSSEASGSQNNAIHRLTVPSGYGSFNVTVNSAERLKINNNGDISFYNDSANQGFFFDSSTSRLGLGTTVPSHKLHIEATDDLALRLTRTGVRSFGQYINGTGNFVIRDLSGTPADRLTINADGSSVFSGSVTADGLTVNGTSLFSKDGGAAQTTAVLIRNTSSSDQTSAMTADLDFSLWDNNTRLSTPQARIGVYGDSTADQNYEAGGQLAFYTNIRSYTSPSLTKRMLIDSFGDISFYDGSGNQGLFWDSSTSRLGLGVTNPSSILTVDSGTATGAAYSPTNFNSAAQIKIDVASAQNNYAGIQFTHSGNTEGFIGLVRPSATTAEADFVIQGYSSSVSGYREKLRISDNGNATFSGSVSSDTFQNASGNLNILSTGNILLKFDSDNNQTNRELNIQSNSGDQLVRITETGATTFSSSVTSTGLTVDSGSGNIGIVTKSTDQFAFIGFEDNTSATSSVYIGADGNDFIARANSVTRLRAASNGDISFYNDSAAQGLFWDSSASSLGIGRTANLRDKLTVTKSDSTTSYGQTTAAIEITNSDNSTSHYSALNFRVATGTYNESLATVSARYSGWNTNVLGELSFGTRGIGQSDVTEHMRISHAGRVGLGNWGAGNPVYALDVKSTDNGADDLIARFASSDSIGRIQLADNSGTVDLAAVGNDFHIFTSYSFGSTAKMVVHNTGNVNIPNGSLMVGATTAPATKGHFYSATSMDQLSVDGIGAIETGINFKSGGTTYGQIYFNNVSPYDMSVMQQYSTGSLILGTNDTPRLTIDSSGNATFSGRTTSANSTIGSGTASTYVDLTVNGASTSNYGPMIELQSAGTAFGKISSYGRIQGGTSTDMFVTTASTNSLLLGTNNTPRVTIDSSGNATFSGSVSTAGNIVNDIGNSGDDSFIELKNTGYTGNITSLRQNADSIRAELNSTERSIFIQAGSGGGVSGAEVRLYTNTQLGLKVDASQNVNIPNGSLMVGATTAPDTALHVKTSADTIVKVEKTGGNYIQLHGTGAGGRIKSDGQINFDVGSNSGALNLASNGNATFSGSVTSPAVDTGSLDLQAIAESKSVTAVDVFVYDTSKDSDGGAWRHRTQHTSWYNETLNTSTRGATKKFPSVAVLVAASGKVTIYDGDEPSMPMWMVFNAGGGSFSDHTMLGQVGSSNRVAVRNAVMGVSARGGQTLVLIDFLKETSEILRSSNDAGMRGFHSSKELAKRNAQSGEHEGTLRQLASNQGNDIAMTVLPNAPIDADTGLPIPTIAVATDGGVSVIKDDGTVVDINYASYTASRFVSFTAKNYLVCNFDNVTTNGRFTKVYRTIPSSDQSSTGTPYNSTNGEDAAYTNDLTASWQGDLKFLEGLPTNRQFDNFSFAHLGGLLILDENEEAPSKGMLADITSDFNTGWMNGDIKLATLSDTDTTNVTGSELVTNGTFASDTAWTRQSGWTISGGTASCNGTNGSYIYQASGLSANTRITISFDITSYTSGSIRAGSTGIANQGSFSGVGTHSVTYTTSASHNPAGVEMYSSSFVGTIDNVSARIIEEDRSVNDNGLQVFGTVTKTAVATGADLVAYSGFTSGQFTGYRLEQPYNSDLAFGANDFSISYWIKDLVDSTDIMGVGKRGTDLAWCFYKDANGGLRFTYSVNGYGYYDVEYQLGNNGTVPNWMQVTVTKRSGVTSMYIDGVLKISNSLSTAAIYAATSGLNIGSGNTNNSIPSSFSLALLRISKTAPTAEQIAKMYNDEKPLFQDGAQATLYGTSDAVTALAYDDDTELLHAGTSSGRSVFQGLRRVDNTTDAVGVAISASNDLIVEE